MPNDGSGGRTIKCSACSGPIPVRTFKAGNVVCPSCGAEKDLSEDLTGRMRALQASLTDRPPAKPPVATRKVAARSNVAPLLVALGIAVVAALAAAAFFLGR